MTAQSRAAALLCALILGAIMFRWDTHPSGLTLDRWTGVAWVADTPLGLEKPARPRVGCGLFDDREGEQCQPRPEELAAYERALREYEYRLSRLRLQRRLLSAVGWLGFCASLAWLALSMQRPDGANQSPGSSSAAY